MRERMMRDREPESPILKLPLLTTPNINQSSSSLTTSDSYNYDFITLTSIPFKWEQAPGKPILSSTKITKLPSPTTLDLPPRLQSKLSSPRGNEGCSGKYTVGEMVMSERVERRKKGVFGSWGGFGSKEVSGGSFVFPADFGGEDSGGGLKRGKRVRRNPSFSDFEETKSRFWVNMYEGLKQVMPWRSKKLKKQGLRF